MTGEAAGAALGVEGEAGFAKPAPETFAPAAAPPDMPGALTAPPLLPPMFPAPLAFVVCAKTQAGKRTTMKVGIIYFIMGKGCKFRLIKVRIPCL